LRSIDEYLTCKESEIILTILKSHIFYEDAQGTVYQLTGASEKLYKTLVALTKND